MEVRYRKLRHLLCVSIDFWNDWLMLTCFRWWRWIWWRRLLKQLRTFPSLPVIRIWSISQLLYFSNLLSNSQTPKAAIKSFFLVKMNSTPGLISCKTHFQRLMLSGRFGWDSGCWLIFVELILIVVSCSASFFLKCKLDMQTQLYNKLAFRSWVSCL